MILQVLLLVSNIISKIVYHKKSERCTLSFFYKERSELVTSWSFSYFYSRSLKSFFRVSNFYSRSLQSFFKFSENCILYQPFLGQI